MNPIKPTLALRVVIPVLIGYMVLSIIGLYYHELGLEEGQQYVFARDSRSLADLYHNMRYEGHPRTWCILLYGIIHFITPSLVAVRLLHFAITTTTVYLFLRYAPIHRLVKIGFVFGYYFLFEYNLQSRSYALGILLLFAGCLLLTDPVRHLPLIAILLLLLCNTDIFYAFAAVGLFLYMAIVYAQQDRLFTRPFYLLSAFFIIGLACTFIQAQIPREDYIVHSRLNAGFSRANLASACLALTAGWLPIPADRFHFWNSFWIAGPGTTAILRPILALFFLLSPAVLLRAYPRALVFYYSSLLLLLGLMMVTGFTAARYFGMVVIYLLAAAWLAGNEAGVALPMAPVFRPVIAVVVLVQLAVGIFAWGQDLTRPFSQAKNAVAWLKARRLTDQPVVVNGYIAGPALSTYLGKKLWYLNTGGEGSFCLWRQDYFPGPANTITGQLAAARFLPRLDSFLLLSSKDVDRSLLPDGAAGFHFAPLQHFSDGILPMEDCYMYQAIRTVNH
ncbi:MAG TPA: hypothetical protein VGM89_18370 [Puia sp.]